MTCTGTETERPTIRIERCKWREECPVQRSVLARSLEALVSFLVPQSFILPFPRDGF